MWYYLVHQSIKNNMAMLEIQPIGKLYIKTSKAWCKGVLGEIIIVIHYKQVG